jgi:hypothetical protein
VDIGTSAIGANATPRSSDDEEEEKEAYVSQPSTLEATGRCGPASACRRFSSTSAGASLTADRTKD